MSGFDKAFPGDVKAELDRRSGLIASKGEDWNYNKYAFITIQATEIVKP